MLVLFLYNYRLTTVTSCFIVDIEISTTERGKKEITRMMIRIMTKTAKVASAWKVNYKRGFGKLTFKYFEFFVYYRVCIINV